MPAQAAQTTSTISDSSASEFKAPKHTDSEVLQLLLAGQGPIAEKNPELLRYLGFDIDRPMTDPKVLDKLVKGFLQAHPEFQAEIRTPLETGDPRTIEITLMKLTNMYTEYAQESYGLSNRSMSSSKGCGKVKVCVVAYAAAVANAVVYANAGLATFALAAAAAVFIVGPVFYLDDKDGVESRVSSLEKDEITLRLADALRA